GREIMKMIIKKNNQEIVVAEKMRVADNFWSRLKGLMFLPAMKEFDGLLIKRCNSIHTCFMNFPIDVIFLDSRYKVIKIIRKISPWRMTIPHFRASQVLELPGETLSTEVAEGDYLEVICTS
ncbi:MAG: DUF192 domain-containing protein, partial [Pseudomonadota bacterium]